MNIRTKALAVHLLTATGAVFAMLAMLAAVNGKWDMMFVWLVIAFFVDGVDGPLCLLYTSPSPRDVEESRMPSSA